MSKSRSFNPENLNVESVEPLLCNFNAERNGSDKVDTVAFLVRFNGSTGSMMLAGSRSVPLTTVAVCENQRMSLSDTSQCPGFKIFVDLVPTFYYQVAGQKLIDSKYKTLII